MGFLRDTGRPLGWLAHGVLLAALCTAVLLLAGCAADAQSAEGLSYGDGNGVAAHGQLSVSQGRLIGQDGEPFQLRGLSTHGICWYPNYINAGAIKSLREAGGNVLRIAMYTQPEGGYLSEPQVNLDRVLQAIENARAMDCYAIVDWHILEDGDPNAHLDAAITFFDAVASRYPNDPAILYEICNEPNGVTWDDITRYAYAICHVIRQYSPDAVIILGTPEFSGALNPPMEAPFPEENILYAYHYYAGEHADYSSLRNALEAQLPVMVTEWGIGAGGDGAPVLDAGREFARYLNENNVSWCGWSLCNKDEVYSVLRPDCGRLSQWQDSDLTDVGRVLFAALGGKI